jgi:hypothetical protein
MIPQAALEFNPSLAIKCTTGSNSNAGSQKFLQRGLRENGWCLGFSLVFSSVGNSSLLSLPLAALSAWADPIPGKDCRRQLFGEVFPYPNSMTFGTRDARAA